MLHIHADIDYRWTARDVADIAFAAGYNCAKSQNASGEARRNAVPWTQCWAGGQAVNREELELLIQWFQTVQDLAHPKYLTRRDYALAKRIHETLGWRVPKSITKHLPNVALTGGAPRAVPSDALLERDSEQTKGD